MTRKNDCTMANNDRAMKTYRVQSRVAWSAIVAGSLTAFACLINFGALWASIDYTLPPGSLPAAPICVGALSAAAMFIGGLVTTRLCAGETLREAGLYGLLTWSVTGIILLYFAINGAYLLGTTTLLGTAGLNDVIPAPVSASWLAFVGVTLSLVATFFGALTGFVGSQKLGRSRRKQSAAAKTEIMPEAQS